MTPFGAYELDCDRERIQFTRVHSWLTGSYWSPGISQERVVQAAQNSSLLVGAYLNGQQVAYLRVVSDQTTFAWVCDVIVDEAHRAKGLGKALVRYALADVHHQGLRRWVLATRDAHGVYKECGFESIQAIHRWMIYGANPPA